jgi:hypothetical protein
MPAVGLWRPAEAQRQTDEEQQQRENARRTQHDRRTFCHSLGWMGTASDVPSVVAAQLRSERGQNGDYPILKAALFVVEGVVLNLGHVASVNQMLAVAWFTCDCRRPLALSVKVIGSPQSNHRRRVVHVEPL